MDLPFIVFRGRGIGLLVFMGMPRKTGEIGAAVIPG